MYLEQVKSFKAHPILYFILPIAFLLLMVVNYVFSMDMDTNEVIEQTIAKIGVNGTFVLMIIPLSIGLFVVWFWVKFVQGQSLVSLTTSRSKVDFKRIFFSFFLWASITVVMTFIAYYAAPENFVINFKSRKFFIFLVLFDVFISRNNVVHAFVGVSTHQHRRVKFFLLSFFFNYLYFLD